MPVDMREWLPEDDLVFVVLDAYRSSGGHPDDRPPINVRSRPSN